MTKPSYLSEASDLELMARAREGDEDARREVVRRQGPRVFNRIYRIVRHHEAAEDLTQETFVKMFRALERNGPERKPSAWIGRIAQNTALDYVRLKRPDSTRSHLAMTPGQIDESLMRMLTPPNTSTSDTDLAEFAAALKRALRRLRPEYRRCFTLRHVQHRSHEEIAQILDLPVGTVKSRLHRATQQLRRMLRPVLPSSSEDPAHPA